MTERDDDDDDQVAAEIDSRAAALERHAAQATDAAYEAAARSAEARAVAWATNLAGERSVRAAVQARQELEDDEAAMAAYDAYEHALACQELEDDEMMMAAYDEYEDAQARREQEDEDAAMAAYDAYESGRSEQGGPTGGVASDEDAAAAESAVVDALAASVGQMVVATGVAGEAGMQGGGASGLVEVEGGRGNEPVQAAAAAEAGAIQVVVRVVRLARMGL